MNVEDGGRGLLDLHVSPLFLSGESTWLWQVQGLTLLLTHHMTLSRAFPPHMFNKREGPAKASGPYQP